MGINAESPLSGLTVIDFTRILAGPYATMYLGDLGARVIKIEQPTRGDDTRHWGPPFTENGESAYFLCVNRNKESITLNLKHPQGREIARRLIANADIVVENFKVGAMQELGLDYTTMSRSNPGLIYCSISGYGQTGPYRQRPGYDAVIEAEGGIMSITGPAQNEGEADQPYKVGVAIVDLTAGLNAVTGILSALFLRERTGHGQYIDIALLDTQLSWLANVASSYLVSGQPPERHGNAHPSIVPYQVMQAADGHLMLAVGNDDQFRRLAHVIHRPELADDAQFATNAARVANRNRLIPLLEREFAERPVHHWIEMLQSANIPCGPVNDIPTILADPQVAARDMVQTAHHPTTGSLSLIASPLKLSETPPDIRYPPPLLGEHTYTVLRELLELSDSMFEELCREQII